jgi:hypothetical protein
MHLVLKLDPAARTGTVYARSRSLRGARQILRPLEPGHFIVSIIGEYPLGRTRPLARWVEDLAEHETIGRPSEEADLLMALIFAIDTHAHRGEGIPDRPQLRAAAALLPCPAAWIWPAPETVKVSRAV